jgi:anti-sigma B factor antagonist
MPTDEPLEPLLSTAARATEARARGLGRALTVVVDVRGTMTVITASGELDLATAPRLARAVQPALTNDANVLVDLERVNFIDSTGLALLIEAGRTARAGTPRLAITAGHAVLRLVELTRTAGVLPIYGDRGAAVAALTRN